MPGSWAVTMPATRSLTPLDKIDRDLRAARQLRLMPRSPEQDERLQAEIDRLLDERLSLESVRHNV